MANEIRKTMIGALQSSRTFTSPIKKNQNKTTD